MNATVVRRAASGIAKWLASAGRRRRRGRRRIRRPVPLGRVRARLGRGVRGGRLRYAGAAPALPTPVLAFAVQHFAAVAGVMVTASHNPPEDNGYKVYLGDGAQLAPPTDAQIEAAIRGGRADASHTRRRPAMPCWTTRSSTRTWPRWPAWSTRRGPDCGSSTRRCTASAPRSSSGPSPPPASSDRCRSARQAEPDPRFPTVAFPNPEEPGALDLALALARDQDADLVIANDPDADRCAVAVPDGAEWRMLRGDEVGVLLADAMLTPRGPRNLRDDDRLVDHAACAGARQGVGYAETLTGFKWIVRAAPDLVYGYEEALGYAVAPNLVRDKDGISAALLVAERAAALKSVGSSLVGRLDELAAEYGRYRTDQVSVRVDEIAVIDQIMARLRANPPDPAARSPDRGRGSASGYRCPALDAARRPGRGAAVRAPSRS